MAINGKRFAVAQDSFMPASSISDLLQGVESLRARLEQAGGSVARPEDSLKAGALAEEVKRLCRQSAESGDPHEVAMLLVSARERLDELEALLGPH